MRVFKLIGLTLFIFVLLNGCCTTEDDYDITGTWNITIIALELNRTLTITFTGSKASGTNNLWELNGTYEVSGETVTFSVSYWDREWGTVNETYTGIFDSENQMSGTASFEFVDDNNTETGTWTATR